MKKILTTVLLSTVLAFAVHAQTSVSGGIYSNTTWTLAGSPYIVTDTVVVFPGVMLTIQPGVTVKFADGKGLEIRQAKLIATGTSTAPITFTSNSVSPTLGIYPGIYLNGGTVPPVFNFCNFFYANCAISTNNSYTLTIKNSNMMYNNMGVQGMAMNVNIDSCIIKYNNTGMQVGGGIVANSHISGNQSGMVQEGFPSTIVNCMIDSNQVGIYDATGSVLNSIIRYNSTGMECGHPTIIKNCTINANHTGVIMGNDSITNSVIDSNSVVGIDHDGGEYDLTNYIYNNEIAHNGNGINEFGIDIITRNRIENNAIGIQVTKNSVMPTMTMNLLEIYCNKICTNTSYDFKYIGTNNLPVGSNYWCTPDSSSTEAVIFDGYDNASYGLINFMPLDTSMCYLDLLTTGISTYETSSFSFGIFPNPATDHLTVELPATLAKKEIQIFNMLGDVEYSSIITDQKTDVDISSFAKGIYFIQLTTGNNNISRKKFIKQ